MASTAAAAEWVTSVVQAYRRGRSLALLFQYDGALTPIARHPSLALFPPHVRALLARLVALPGVTVGVISGRPLGELRQRVGLDGLYCAGSGGLEIDLLTERITFPTAAAFDEMLTAVHERLVEPLGGYPGTWVERKPSALTVHFRGLPPLPAACLRAEVARLLAPIPAIRFRVGSATLEITPAGGWDQGMAVSAVLARAKGSRGRKLLPVYFGASSGDTEAMLVALTEGGVAVGVGDEAPDVAAHRVPDPPALAEQLSDLYRRLAAAEGVAVPAEADPPDRGEPPPENGNVLSGVVVVDPDPDHRDRLSRGLRRLGWRVWSYATADEADRALAERAGEVRAVLVDLDQPGLAGGRLLAKWGQDHPEVVRCGMAGAPAYMASAFRRVSGLPLLSKPVDPALSNRQLRQLIHDPAAGQPA